MREYQLKTKPLINPQGLQNALITGGVLRGATLQQVRHWLQYMRKKNPINQDQDVTLGSIHTLVLELQSQTTWSDTNPHRSILLPLEQYVIVGDEVKEPIPVKQSMVIRSLFVYQSHLHICCEIELRVVRLCLILNN